MPVKEKTREKKDMQRGAFLLLVNAEAVAVDHYLSYVQLSAGLPGVARFGFDEDEEDKVLYFRAEDIKHAEVTPDGMLKVTITPYDDKDGDCPSQVEDRKARSFNIRILKEMHEDEVARQFEEGS